MRVPKVSIGLPVYNGENYIETALQRLLQQDYEDFELIISDNASSDRTQKICLEFAQKDRRIRYFRNSKNIGLSANHNLTFAHSRGEFFKWVAHDDDYPSFMLRRLVREIEEAPTSVCLVYSFCEYIDKNGVVEGIDSDGVAIGHPEPYKRLAHLLRYVHMYNSQYGLIRSEVLRRTRLYGLFPFADHVLLAELAMLGMFLEIPEALLRIRRHSGRSCTANTTTEALRELFDPGQNRKYSILGLWGRVHLELVRSALIIPLKSYDRFLCSATAMIIPQYWMLRGILGKHKKKILSKYYLTREQI